MHSFAALRSRVCGEAAVTAAAIAAAVIAPAIATAMAAAIAAVVAAVMVLVRRVVHHLRHAARPRAVSQAPQRRARLRLVSSRLRGARVRLGERPRAWAWAPLTSDTSMPPKKPVAAPPATYMPE